MAIEKIQYAFYFDQTRCMSCNSCTVACKDWNQVEPGPVAWRKQFTYEKDGGFFPLSMGCNHCEEPACKNVCPYNAISKTNDGIVYVNRDLCQGALSCITACPFAKPQIAGDKQEPNAFESWKVQHPMQKCDMCKDRLDKGERPACVQSCVGRALDFGTKDYILSTYSGAVQLNPGDFPYAYVNNTNDTKPSFYVKKKTSISITKASSNFVK